MRETPGQVGIGHPGCQPRPPGCQPDAMDLDLVGEPPAKRRRSGARRAKAAAPVVVGDELSGSAGLSALISGWRRSGRRRGKGSKYEDIKPANGQEEITGTFVENAEYVRSLVVTPPAQTQQHHHPDETIGHMEMATP